MLTLTRRLAITLAAFGISTVLTAGTASAGDHGGKGDRTERTCEALACTAAQRTQIQAIQTASQPQIKTIHETVRGLRDQQRAEWTKASPDVRTLERLDTQIDAQQAKIRDLRRAADLKIHALLTADQRTKFVAQMDRHGKGHGGGGKPGNTVKPATR